MFKQQGDQQIWYRNVTKSKYHITIPPPPCVNLIYIYIERERDKERRRERERERDHDIIGWWRKYFEIMENRYAIFGTKGKGRKWEKRILEIPHF